MKSYLMSLTGTDWLAFGFTGVLALLIVGAIVASRRRTRYDNIPPRNASPTELRAWYNTAGNTRHS